MELSNDDLDKIKRMAAAAFSYVDIADVLELPHAEVKALLKDEQSALYKAYRTGYLSRTLELRERIFKDARNGSSPAQTIAHKLLDEAFVKNTL